ncbi:NADH:flavin oxidoreductase [Mucilaginibacter phyllosphaerae]|uniref:2,4-dienoyl-CoA reductase-like NADH-dependent reductase (Old Yellow Enzyme family) n=1 Tax=Mucilaginibacter phyllosphaerae TaxID=1812349 RepID=A0A4Y8AMD7_9SPHI|nr:NADH:flavin oxidoreductase [Mucilaginibacter phyllosphaerae]MBB3967441.1 2,4-dienoyl-CoA reductase-like NADH-dependent reductase (Old Yellow Enzyme family) [Mucilaginibacter phyllosphaerae]TEW69491.1 NADH:flavin oxidoreductase [Mucilaginibacter phyllosphaerae]GGH20720.1 12-oxophytodienoate reductase [Mucilaginibacter phyllosphaerae]
MNTDSLFKPFSLKTLNIKNRIVMAPMTRSFSPNGVPTDDVAAYYKKRAEGEAGLILSEGTVINRVSSSNDANVPHFYGADALAGWQQVINEVHTAGGAMGPQIWHMGVMDNHASGWVPSQPFEGPSGLNRPGNTNGNTMTDADIADTIAAFGQAAADAKALGFDTVEIHGAHGYLIDQFFWDGTNQRTDVYGGKTLAERTRFGVEVIKEVRKRVGEDFALIIRLSQFKPSAYDFKLAKDPQEMEAWLTPLVDAGVDILHCSQRRFWEPEFEGSDLNFAGWAKKLTGKATITVGSVGLSGDFFGAFAGESSQPSSLDELLRRFDRGDFDLVGVGRPLLSDPAWAQKIRNGETDELKGFTPQALGELVM